MKPKLYQFCHFKRINQNFFFRVSTKFYAATHRSKNFCFFYLGVLHFLSFDLGVLQFLSFDLGVL